MLVLLLALWSTCVLASVGDRLPQYKECTSQCIETLCYSNLPYLPQYDINIVSRYLFLWSCPLDCDYKCRSHVANIREAQLLPIVQFHGKWPFDRWLGITEVFSVLFSIGNLCANLINLVKFSKLIRGLGHGKNSQARGVMLFQYWLLLAVSVVGWLLSTIFHTRDIPLTETLDYLGAGAIIMANFNAISIRYFELFRAENQRKRQLYQSGLLFILLCHYLKLARKWDYQYNMKYNVVIGLSALAMWVAHSLRVYRRYDSQVFNSIQLSPYESKIQQKLGPFCKVRSRLIPLIPVVLNVYLTTSVSLELFDFAPIAHLIDSHALWHLCTIFPPLIWYDWNLWDLELSLIDKMA
ncbi:hypothetical protein C7M61_000421 [Candidozyma pseudohaemuli]|uniref:Post-GPI attachment to proteins factor 3 n=1 Tax=Candidozyma pseudohaemuli TaxID=418784 RepID=A0A2P7YXV4_9ASCO|nr:hypothetical protein C7M61_000421 [[Candida] pseudohaemulonii]PSK40766.1 hypothetical protein C7M61_000421 [[Candida] pseudohaemulonii]